VLSAVLEAAGEHGPMPLVLVNKIDRTAHEDIAKHLLAASEVVDELAEKLGAQKAAKRVEFFPLSAKIGRGVPEFVEYVAARMPEGPFFYPEDEVSDLSEMQYIAELVREQLFRKMREEIPHSLHCRVAEYEWPNVTVEILVERESQKGMVIGKGGELLKKVGQNVRRQLKPGAFIELHVVVDKDWQQKPDRLERLGY
jgi:GTP-binding protein Era